MEKWKEKQLKEEGITADKIAKNELTDEQYRSLVMLAECINVHRPFRPKKSSSYEIDYYSHIVQFENRYFHLTETVTTDFCKRTCIFTYSDVYEMEQWKYEEVVPVT